MSPSNLTFLPFIAAAFSIGLAVLVTLQNRRSFVHRLFSGGMILLAIETVTIGMSARASLATEIIYWQNMRLIVLSLLPGVWLFFTFIYARANYKEVPSRWRWVLLAVFAIPLVISIFFRKSFFISEPFQDSSLGWLIRVGSPGYVFHVYLLISAVLILMSLERTLRISVGHIRWQIKYMVLGIGAIFGVWIYTVSQTILFQSLDTGLLLLNAGALAIADVLILRSVLRTGSFKLEFYPSQSFLYKSFSIFIAGIYLLATGILAKLIQHLNSGTSFYLIAFFIFLALIGLSIVLLSDRLHHKMRRLIATHLNRPQFDYQKEWTNFTEKTSTITDVKKLCMTVSEMISQVFEVLSVTVWLLDESRSRMVPTGSTVFSETGAGPRISENAVRELLKLVGDGEAPLDLDDPKMTWPNGLKQLVTGAIKEARVRYCMPLSAGGNLLGVITLGDKVEYATLSFEEKTLLKTIADQTAGNLLNLKLLEDLRKAKEIETVQTMSSFVVHDIKNLASALSLTMQNLPVHFNNPDFRNDALLTMKQTIDRMNKLCSNLSTLGRRTELKKVETNLNEFIKNWLSHLNGSVKVHIIQDFGPVAKPMIDPEEIQKVLTNLMLNASEAVAEKGQIRLTTERKGGWAVLSVSDNGCGISKEFMEKSLFRPFKTTKKKGMGIGLFQSKMIVEAHEGRIEVESEEGKGTTFKVLLPVQDKK